MKTFFGREVETIVFKIGEWYSGASISVMLPDGPVLNIAKNTQEFELFSFLNSIDSQVDSDRTKRWIPLDKVHFENGKVNLIPESEKQLKNIAMILQFFPNFHLKVGGYIDETDTGTDETNMSISHERAKISAEKLISFGIAANQVTYEGYGSKHPVSQHNCTECIQADDRCVEIRVACKQSRIPA